MDSDAHDPPDPISLRPYQIEARDRILAELEQVRATLLVLATGLGKTIVFSDVAREYVGRGCNVLVLAHRGELLDQASATLRRFGLSVAIEQGDQRVDPSALPDVVVASVQTLRGKRLAAYASDAFGLVVIDEAHHSIAKTYRAVLEHFRNAKVLGVTATADRTDRVGLHNVIESVAYKMEIGAGIAGGWLAPLELRSVVVEDLDISHVRSVAGELDAGQLEAELTRDEVLHQVAGPLAELAIGRQTLLFAVGVQQAHELARVLIGYGVRAAAIDGTMGVEQRAAVLGEYHAGRVQVLANAMLLAEGFDAPLTSCIALVRPTRSRSLLTQMVGRGTRLADGKRNCLILDFVPKRAGKIRLSAPADVLAGRELPDDLLTSVRQMSGGASADLGELIQRAEAQQAAAAEAARVRAHTERERVLHLVRQVGVAFAAPRLDVAMLLSAMEPGEHSGYGNPDTDLSTGSGGGSPRSPRMNGSRPATPAQRDALARAGFDLPEPLNMREASALFQVLDSRRERGLCTLRQGKLLRKYGLRDDVPMSAARQAIDAIASNGWRPPAWLYRDERFAQTAEAPCPA